MWKRRKPRELQVAPELMKEVLESCLLDLFKRKIFIFSLIGIISLLFKGKIIN